MRSVEGVVKNGGRSGEVGKWGDDMKIEVAGCGWEGGGWCCVGEGVVW